MFCSNCGKRIQNSAKFCMYCGNPVNFIDDENDVAEDALNEEKTECCVEGAVYSENDDYLNCVGGHVSFQKMFKKFFSEDIKEYFSFKGTYSRLEYFYARLIIYLSSGIAFVPFGIVGSLSEIIAILCGIVFFIAFVWLMCASYVKRLKDLGVSLWVMVIPPICGILIRGDEDGIKWIGIIISIYYTACVMFLPGEKFRQEEDECITEEDTNKENPEDAEKEVDIEAFSAKDGCTLLIIVTAIIIAIITKWLNN